MNKIRLFLTVLLLAATASSYAALDDVMLGYHPYPNMAPLVLRDIDLNFVTQSSSTISDTIDAVLWIESGRMLSGSAQGDLRLYDSSMALLDTVSSLGPITDLGALSGGKVAVCTMDGNTYIFSTDNDELSQLYSRQDALSYVGMAVQSTDHIVMACYNGSTQHLKRLTDTLANAGGATIPNTDANSVDLVALSGDRIAVALDDQQVRIVSADMSTRLAYYKDSATPGNGNLIFDIAAKSDDTLVLAYRNLTTNWSAIRLRGGEALNVHVGYKSFPGYGECTEVTSFGGILVALYGGNLRLLDNTATMGNLVLKGVNINGDSFGDIYFQKAPPTVITAPADRIVAGSVTNIEWLSNDTAGENVKIEFSRDNGNTWSIIAYAATNNGSYQWAVPDIVSTECLLKITEANYYNSTVSDQTFEIFHCNVPDLNGDCISNIPDVEIMATDWLSRIDN